MASHTASKWSDHRRSNHSTGQHTSRYRASCLTTRLRFHALRQQRRGRSYLCSPVDLVIAQLTALEQSASRLPDLISKLRLFAGWVQVEHRPQLAFVAAGETFGILLQRGVAASERAAREFEVAVLHLVAGGKMTIAREQHHAFDVLVVDVIKDLLALARE